MKQFLVWILLAGLGAPAAAKVTLPRLVRDSMILQRDQPITLWGWAAAGEKIAIRFNGQQLNTTAAHNGTWQVKLSPMKAGGPYTMNITASNELLLKDIWIGDVWLCAGQSNMVHQLQLHEETYANDIAAAQYPQIRQFWVPTLTQLQQPQHDIPDGYWKADTPQDVRQFSAVAWFFARSLYEKYKVPIGIINTSVGGTPIEAWTSEAGFQTFPAVLAIIQKNKDTAYVNNRSRMAAAFDNANRSKQETDKGLNGPVHWYDPAYIPTGWRTINVPGYWEDQGIKNLDGVVWYRKEIDVPAAVTNIPAKLYLGRIVDADQVYVNGVRIGTTGYQYPQRRYPLPAGLLQPGKNVITVRVVNNSGKGGFVPDKPYYLAAGNQIIDLKGYWQYKVGDVFTPTAPHITALSAQNQPTALFNAMVAPLKEYTIKGILWYQGESNTGNPNEYAALLKAFIQDWRNQWRQPHLPFIYAQLPNFMDVSYLPAESNWALLREAQLQALSLPNTGMATTIDLGEWNDIHPDNKKDVGLRLSFAAQQVAYGENIVYSGPVYQSATIQDNKIALSFSNTGSGLVTNDGEPPGSFVIAGADKKFVRAEAAIVDGKIVVWSNEIVHPLYVRYAWADNPDHANLFNKEGLPASPFRTDETGK
jgi:sialate O-acetylesterase